MLKPFTQSTVAVLRGVSNALAALFTSLAGLTVLILAIPLVSTGQIEGVYLALLPLTAIASFEAVPRYRSPGSSSRRTWKPGGAYSS